MRLTPELFEQITGCKESALEQVNKRRSEDPRLASRLPLAFRTIACRLKDDGYDRPVPVQVCDISIVGLGLTHVAEVALGKKFAICLKSRAGSGGVVTLQCETLATRAIQGGLVRVGASFCAVEETSALLRAIAPRPSPAEPHPPSAPAARAHAPLSEADEIKRIRDALLS